MSFDEQLDRLYQLPLADFIGARNDLAKRLRADGDRDGAERVKKLAKPSLTAWVVNQLHFQARPRLDALLDAGEKLRTAITGGAGALRTAMKARREAVADLLALAAEILDGAGQELTRVHRQRLTRTLEAFASGHAGTVPGRLAEDLEPPGFDAVSDLAASLAQMPRRPPKLELVTEATEKRPAALAEVVDLAAERRTRADKAREQKRADARGAVAAAEEKLAELERQAGEARAALAAAERREAEARAAAEDAARRVREARREAEAAAASAKRAAAGLDAARGELRRLEGT